MRYLLYNISRYNKGVLIMEQSRKLIVDGMSFIRSGRQYYYNSHRRLYLHRYLWEKVNGKIPEGYQIHHIDHNPLNNSIDNLELVKKGEHQKKHGAELTDEQREWKRNNMIENAIPSAVEWHKSKEGKVWHKEHYENTKRNLRIESNFKCEMCENEFVAVVNGHNRFCSNKCKAKYRRVSGVDNATRNCIWCNGEYSVNKYSKSTYCSRSCKMKDMHFKRKSKDSPNLRE